ncbi:MAG: RluA family pseudouridine synthase [Syntrophomonadaceae bacterium]
MEKNELFYFVRDGDNCIYLRDVLKHRLGISRSLLNRLKEEQRIRVNNQISRTDYRLQAGDLVSVDIGLQEQNPIEPVDIELDIVYEDADLLLLNKPPGLAVIPRGRNSKDPTLANGVSFYWMRQGAASLFRPINRLDKDTSGLILIGKSQYAHQAIFRQIKQGILRRTYLAVVKGGPPGESGCIDLPIAHLDPENSAKRSVDESGKTAVTYYTVLQRLNKSSVLSLTLGTGRTHQIRVHLSHLGCPLYGDVLYGRPSCLINRQALHASRLRFIQPRTGEWLEFEAPLPDDLCQFLDKLYLLDGK